jgi:phosphatidylinositol glycan class O
VMNHLGSIDGKCHHYHHTNLDENHKTVKIMDSMIRQLIEHMDNQTTLVVFGDHGCITEDGSHGGVTPDELRTALFAYQKTPFPMSNTYLDN